MKKTLFIALFSISLLLFMIISYAGVDNPPNSAIHKDFGSYWFQGKAELTRYELNQVRYGQVHKGDAVLIFVTEDFLPDRQVKHEFGPAPDNVAKILKLNFTRKFYTGIYPYSTMSSVFTPLNGSRTLKVTTTVQEWCGHTFMQLNASENAYHGKLFSYFQKEGDNEFKLDKVLLEDEIWTQLRLNPDNLPTGEIRIIPGTQYQRFLHTEPSVHKAVAKMSIVTNNMSEYKIAYSELNRTLIIRFDPEFPHEISEWEEIYRATSGGKSSMTTRATKTHSVLLDYWNKNGVMDRVLLKELGLN